MYANGKFICFSFNSYLCDVLYLLCDAAKHARSAFQFPLYLSFFLAAHRFELINNIGGSCLGRRSVVGAAQPSNAIQNYSENE